MEQKPHAHLMQLQRTGGPLREGCWESWFWKHPEVPWWLCVCWAPRGRGEARPQAPEAPVRHRAGHVGSAVQSKWERWPLPGASPYRWL